VDANHRQIGRDAFQHGKSRNRRAPFEKLLDDLETRMRSGSECS
jgi:hypothetical protein